MNVKFELKIRGINEFRNINIGFKQQLIFLIISTYIKFFRGNEIERKNRNEYFYFSVYSVIFTLFLFIFQLTTLCRSLKRQK